MGLRGFARADVVVATVHGQFYAGPGIVRDGRCVIGQSLVESRLFCSFLWSSDELTERVAFSCSSAVDFAPVTRSAQHPRRCSLQTQFRLWTLLRLAPRRLVIFC